MCGFLLSSLKNQSFEKFKDLTKLIEKRGPDLKKIIKLKNLKLSHTRLKILDINKRSNQPFYDTKKRFYLLYNE